VEILRSGGAAAHAEMLAFGRISFVRFFFARIRGAVLS